MSFQLIIKVRARGHNPPTPTHLLRISQDHVYSYMFSTIKCHLFAFTPIKLYVFESVVSQKNCTVQFVRAWNSLICSSLIRSFCSRQMSDRERIAQVAHDKFLMSDLSESLRSITKNEQCERIAQVAHQK